ncbi:GPI mannosyltransferase 1 [Ceratocystis fimbriata CBS 114723]|uniref:GPI mannosyltransferase 1 n=1 Tax=Ceratocystis fimbriata CBS 114723 TaxID=1035309 RepID=A0A2C5X3G9_9PEZI|nr:GPI mannosyltransferase 1 [Ceratocystis fimbriata CBS 114723]
MSLISGLYPSALLRTTPLFLSAAFLRTTLLLYGLWQDANTPVKYTDIDYLVFTDAARFTLSPASGTPYDRETYRYTPLLAWLLLPSVAVSSNNAAAVALFAFGKVIFAVADLLAGWFLLQVLYTRGVRSARAHAYAAIWLLNPMVATISTRGSSEGLLGVLTAGLLWAVSKRRFTLAALVLGFSVHFKIYPFIYAPAIVWWMDMENIAVRSSKTVQRPAGLAQRVLGFVTPQRVSFAAISFATFMALNIAMYALYGYPFVLHTYLHHITRVDHRHNFSVYNTLLYLTSAEPSTTTFRIESVAFIPQLLLSTLLIPIAVAKRDLATSMMAQTFAFVTFNKVCTSQYFLWYMIFLPICLPNSPFTTRPRLGVTALLLWIISQSLWLQQGFQLEFMGESTFVPGLWIASIIFFLVNCWILGIILADSRTSETKAMSMSLAKTKKTN